MFEQATREKLRIATPKGGLSVEQLWDLPLQSATGHVSLDSIAVDLDAALKTASTGSFVTTTTPLNKELQLKFDIVLHIIKVKLDENKQKQDSKLKEQERERLKGLIASKQQEVEANTPLDELQKRLAELG